MTQVVKSKKEFKEWSIDPEDYDKIKGYTWSVHGNYMATQIPGVGKKNQKKVFMHRLIMGVDDRNLVVRFKDGNGFNMKRDNLYLTTKSDMLQEICKR